ncbi:putative vacuolar membrane protein [Beauveria bassiana D1-5]|uniref:Putative vacuolar membrane protein n=1 Tax=Beauveria bassiana D1-5 TaxID=1245745 RepID=A0A0A2W368_BEABA|nr:putative vacuolar membrane protein [Beauveria bassiana D1-5]
MPRPNQGVYGTPLLSKPENAATDNDDAAERGRSNNGTLSPGRAAAVPALAPRPALSRRSTAMRSRCAPRAASPPSRRRAKSTPTPSSSSSWIVLWPAQLLILRLQRLDQPWPVFWRRHKQLLKTTALMVEMQTLDVFGTTLSYSARSARYMLRVTALVTTALTVAGLSWYIAVSMTTPSDLTAIYNCSAFFAYAFSVPLLREPLRLDKSVAVLIAIVGVLVVAYGDTGGSGAPAGGDQAGTSSSGPDASAESRFLGNMVIGFGSVLYGLYEVLYKRLACPPDGVSPGRGMIFANTFGSLIGLFTLLVLWIPIPVLNSLGWEKFALPDAATGRLVLLAVLCNAIFSGSFLVLISLTSPVLSSVAALLTIFIVALADWALTGQPLSGAATLGGAMIVLAFLALSWSTYREMTEHEAQKLAVDLTDSDDEGGNLSESDV